jgi:hypothetical protein
VGDVVPPAGGVIGPILSVTSPTPQSGRYSGSPAPAPVPASALPSGGRVTAAPAVTMTPAPGVNLVPWAGSAGVGAVLAPAPGLRVLSARAGTPIETSREAKPLGPPPAPVSPADRERDGGGFGSSGGGGPGPVAGIATTMPRTPAGARCGFGAGPSTRPPHWWFFDPHNHPS